MEELGFGSLWLQVILVAVATFILSAIIWTVMPWHKGDFKNLPDEEAIRQALLSQGVGLEAGQWRIPGPTSMAECRTPEFQERYVRGPVGIFQLEKAGPMVMGKRLAMSFGYQLVVAFFVAYVLRQAIETGDTYMRVFQMAGAVAFGAHFFGHVPDAIWFSKSWRRVGLHAFDALLESLIAAGIFASMWPWA